MYTLYCDPTDATAVRFQFGQCPGTLLRQQVQESPRAETLLQTIAQVVADDPIEQIVLVNQAASFTLIRVLVSVCNALAYSRQARLFQLDRPVQWQALNKQLRTSHVLLQPHYSGDPNITYATTARK